jgi:hypothetical protein
MNDSKFRWLLRISGNNPAAVKLIAERYLYFTCGLIRGALYNIGINSVVTAEISTVPSCMSFFDNCVFLFRKCVLIETVHFVRYIHNQRNPVETTPITNI